VIPAKAPSTLNRREQLRQGLTKAAQSLHKIAIRPELCMPVTAADLVALFDIEPIGGDRFVGHSPKSGWQRVFGGQVVAQALVASSRTVEARAPHSLHAYFLLGGDPAEPILFEVERVRDGRSFTTRRVVARQRGEAIFVLSASFHIEEEGLDHQFPMPDAPEPDKLLDPMAAIALLGDKAKTRLQGLLERIQPIEFRPLDLGRYTPLPPGAVREPKQSLWVRIAGTLPDDPSVHRAALAYLSDMTLLDTALVAHGRTVFDARFQAASLDHSLWLHRPFRADEWLLYVQDSPTAHGARGLTRGLLYSRAGALVASVAQEGLVRPLPPAQS
jgi:acyl-CoA thioesterase-2